MLTTSTTHPRTRIKGQSALLRSLTLLALRVVRFGEHRATTDAERAWAGRLYDRLDGALQEARGDFERGVRT